jgi:hypothetical protein
MLLGGLVYVFAIVLFVVLKNEPDPIIRARFGRLGTCCMTLITDGALIDGVGYVTRALIDRGRYESVIMFLVFLLLSALTVMNMLIGVLCEVVSAVAASEKENSQIHLVKTQLLSMLKEMDEDRNGTLSRAEIAQVLYNDKALNVLVALNVDSGILLDMVQMSYEEKEELSIIEVMELILMLRGDRPVTMSDLLHCETFMRWKVNQAIDTVESRISTVQHFNQELGKSFSEFRANTHLMIGSTSSMDRLTNPASSTGSLDRGGKLKMHSSTGSFATTDRASPRLARITERESAPTASVDSSIYNA